jgi:NitT/TauT family transport system substrate-binding protein
MVEGSIRVALGDIEGVETLNLFIALERVRERGIDVELTEFAEEDLAAEAVLGGQADVGLGAPYAVIQETGAPIRIICQLQTLRFFAVVDAEAYPDWQALDGETFTVHSRGSGTEAMALLVQQEEGIEFSEISYVTGAEVRATALLQGNVRATFLDIPSRNFVMEEAPDQFHELPLPDIQATDEAFVANVEWLEANPEVAQVLLEETLNTWNAIIEDPNFVAEERERLGLAEDLEPELEEQIVPYFEEAGQEGVFATDCGGEEAARTDFEFYSLVGQVEGDPETLNVEDFWDLGPLEGALEASGSN